MRTRKKKHLLQLVQSVGDVQQHIPALEHPPPLADQVLESLRRTRGDAQDEVVVGNYNFLGGGALLLRGPEAFVRVGRFSRGNAFPLARYLHPKHNVERGWKGQICV